MRNRWADSDLFFNSLPLGYLESDEIQEGTKSGLVAPLKQQAEPQVS